MIEIPTVLILGAGASSSYGFPSGLQLKAEICRGIRDKLALYDDLVMFQDDEQVIQDFYYNLLLSSEMSIDAFLEHNPEYLEVGRRAIANILIGKETHGKLFDEWIDKWLDSENKDNHWYQLLFSELNAPFEEFEKNNLKIITFNYDRSLEYFLWEAMKAKYSGSEVDDGTISKKLHNIPILHIYGKLGTLAGYDSEGTYVPFDLQRNVPNKANHRNHIYEASQQIITIHQAEELDSVLEKAREALLWASRIYFLGFGYHQINMERLFVHEGENLLKGNPGIGGKCFGTAMNVSPHHKRILMDLGLSHMKTDRQDEIRGRTYVPPRFPDSTIYDFLYYNSNSSLD